VAGFGALTAVMLPAYAARDAMLPDREKSRVRDAWVRAWTSALLRLFAVKVELHGEVPTERGLLVVSNHRSTIDIAVLLRTFGGHMVSRADLAGWPLLGAAARKVGTVFVDRKSAKSGALAIRAIRALLDKGENVILFPEGTTFPDDEVRPFQAGAFMAASHSGARILPVGLAYETGSGAAFVNESFPQHLKRMSGAPPTRVAMCIGEPFSGDAKSSLLRDRAHKAVQELVDEARGCVDSALPTR
jgi:1-acyl-sn-glycerol-3-phosphate acyltransferase